MRNSFVIEKVECSLFYGALHCALLKDYNIKKCRSGCGNFDKFLNLSSPVFLIFLPGQLMLLICMNDLVVYKIVAWLLNLKLVYENFHFPLFI